MATEATTLGIVAVPNRSIPLSPLFAARHSMGLIEVSEQLKVHRVSETVRTIAGGPDSAFSVSELLGQEAAELLRSFFQNRSLQHMGEYEIECVRENGRRVAFAINAERDSSQSGETAIVAIRNLAEERIIAAIRDRIRSSTTAHEIFHAMTEELSHWIQFDFCTASIYDDTLEHARVLFNHGPTGTVSWPTRWFDLTPQMSEWIKQAQRQVIDDLRQFRQDPRWNAEHDPRLEDLLEKLQSAFRIPVVRNGRVMASVVFLRSAPRGFAEAHELDLLYSLPVDNAFLMALSYLENEELRFQKDLAEQLSLRSCANMLDKTIADLIVNRLAQHYDWEAISLFRINRDTERFELQAQTGKQSAVLPSDFSQAIAAGIMGESYRTGNLVCVRDVPNSEKYKPLFIKGHSFSTVSELCVPIRVGPDIVGMLNIEDSRSKAFAPREIKAITEMLEDVGSLLERQKNETIIKAAFEWTPSALFITRESGVIDKVNPTAVQMLGYEQSELEGKRLEEVMEPPEIVRSLLRVGSPFRDDVRLVRKDGRRTKVSVAGSRLGEMMGAIITARDIASRQRIEELDCLERIFYDIASQTKIPLAITFSWLTKLKQQFEAGASLDPAKSAADLERIIRQLRRVEITYDHLALYDKNAAGGVPTNPVIIETGKLLSALAGELPHDDAARVEFKGDGLNACIVADIYQTSFVLLSLLSYGLRFLPESRKLEMKVWLAQESGNEWVYFTIAALIPRSRKYARRTTDLLVAKTISDISLGTRTIRVFVQANGGKFEVPETLEGNINVNVAFPVTQIAV